MNARVSVLLFQRQFDAVLSWTYNLGEGALKSSTMLKKINAAQHDEVPTQIKHWNRAGSKVLKGLKLPPRGRSGAVPYTVVLRDACPLSPSVAVSPDAN